MLMGCHFSKWAKSKIESANGFPGQSGLCRVQIYQLEKNGQAGIHSCPEGAKIGFKQLIVEFTTLLCHFEW